MPRRWPLIPTVLVALAIATMIALGVWQLQRAEWKEALLKSYAAAVNKPPVAFPHERDKAIEPYFFRKSEANCYAPYDEQSGAGRNSKGEAGIGHVVTCNLYAPGVSMDEREVRLSYRAVLGWSDSIETPKWSGGMLKGTLMPDTKFGLRLVADPAVAGLQPNETPNIDEVPNNHLAYAGQWFFFALVAAVIYILALRRREQG